VTEDQLSHLDPDGRARMVDVGGKPRTERTARAQCLVLCSPNTARLVAQGELPKGDVIAVARIAGIQAAKRTPELIPLCHQIALSSADVDITVNPHEGEITIVGTARATDRTGVEMEALTATAIAALTVYDMVKSVEHSARITDLHLEEKTGGTGREASPETPA
jgi:cyclic pyranopterin monophosphate synthase